MSVQFPFMNLMTQIEDERAYAKAVNNDMLDKRIVRVAFKPVTNTK